MENPMLRMLNQSRPLTNPTNNLISMLRNAQNPQALMQNLISQNPQIMNLVNQYGGGDPKTAFYAYARQTGQDPDQILSMLRNLK